MGVFKRRGGLTYFDALMTRGKLPADVISTTRGNPGQSIGWAARAHFVICSMAEPAALALRLRLL